MNYQYIVGADGSTLAVSKETGEVIDIVSVQVPAGSIIWTPEQQRKSDKKKKEEEIISRRRSSGKIDPFVFANTSVDFDGLSPAAVARLIYLVTYASYDKSCLMESQRRPLVRSRLAKVLNVSESTVTRLLQELSKFIYVDYQDQVCLCDRDLFFKGGTKGHYGRFIRLYIDRIRNIYLQTPASKHRLLGYVYAMLPYINVEYNALCYNPDEPDIDKIDYMSLDDFCDIAGYGRENKAKLLKAYTDMKFQINGKTAPLIVFLFDGKNFVNSRIFVNPVVMYSGTDYSQVEILSYFIEN